jgi:hypothetical protein
VTSPSSSLAWVARGPVINQRLDPERLIAGLDPVVVGGLHLRERPFAVHHVAVSGAESFKGFEEVT